MCKFAEFRSFFDYFYSWRAIINYSIKYSERMVRVNKKYLEKKLCNQAWQRFLERIKNSGSEDALIVNLKSFLTKTEIAMLEKRLLIPVLLERKMSYRAIGEMIDVSSNTISFVKNNLTRKSVQHRKFSSTASRISEQQLSFLPPRVGHGRWLRKKLYGGNG